MPVVEPGEGQREEREDAASGESGEGRGRLNTQPIKGVADITYSHDRGAEARLPRLSNSLVRTHINMRHPCNISHFQLLPKDYPDSAG